KGQGRGNEAWIYLVPVGGIKPPAAGHRVSSIPIRTRPRPQCSASPGPGEGCAVYPPRSGRSVPSHRKENHAFCERIEDLGPVPISYSYYKRDIRDIGDIRDMLKNLFCASMPFQEGPSFA